MTWRGAFRFALATFPLLRGVHGFIVRRNEARVLRALGIPLPARVADVVPRSATAASSSAGRGPRAWLAAWAPSALLVSLIVLLTWYPEALSFPTPRSRGVFAGFAASTIRVPDDLAVPDSFPLAVAALERLTGRSAERLIVNDHSGQRVPSEMWAIKLVEPDASALVVQAQHAFAAAGFLLFHTTQFDARGITTDAVALAATLDAHVVMKRLGTNGDNFDIGTDLVIAWFRETERATSLRFNAIGFDFVGARIVGKVPDPTGLGERFLQFCPEMRSEISGARQMGRELVEGGLIYCWWD